MWPEELSIKNVREHLEVYTLVLNSTTRRVKELTLASIIHCKFQIFLKTPSSVAYINAEQ